MRPVQHQRPAYRQRQLAGVVALLTLATALVHAAPAKSAPTREPTVDAQRGERGMHVLSELTGGSSQPVFESMRRDFPFLADATAKAIRRRSATT